MWGGKKAPKIVHGCLFTKISNNLLMIQCIMSTLLKENFLYNFSFSVMVKLLDKK
jgi:hypothetical protein